MIDLLKAEFYKLWRKKSFWGIWGISIVLAGILMLDRGRQGSAESYFRSVLYNIPMLYFLILIFGALFIGEEFENRTLGACISAGRQRILVLSAKAVSFFTACILIISTPLLSISVAGLIITQDPGAGGAFFLQEGMMAVLAVCAMGSLPFLAAFLFKDVGKTLVIPMAFYLLMLFALNSNQAEAVANLLPIGQIRLLSMEQLTIPCVRFVMTDVLWISICYAGAYLAFYRSDLN